MNLLVLLLMSFSLTHSALAEDHEGPTTAPLTTERPKDERPALARCDLFPRQKGLHFLRENWAFYASGLDFLRGHPSLASAEPKEAKLALLDTGLKCRENPRAGDSLSEASLEDDEDGHGTAVAGIAASESLGVNPALNVVMLKLPDRENAALTQLIHKAADDKSEGVINLSLPAGDDPSVEKAVLRALAKGKWIVSASTGSMARLGDSDQPGFFRVGTR